MPETANYSPYGHPKGHMDADGNWVRNADSPSSEEGDVEAISKEFVVSFATLDAAALWTVPAGQRILIEDIWWEVTTSFTGGSSSAIGASSDQTGLTTKGSLIGAASGDVAAALTAGNRRGTEGSAMGSPVILEGGKKVLFDRITSVFTAGAGKLHIIGRNV